jgi:hypothetical protein
MWGGFLCFFAVVLIVRMRREIVARRIQALQTLYVADDGHAAAEA